MPIEPGQMLAHYRILEKLGEGGMGVVWKAEDTRLGREVAIKLLPEGGAWDPDREARFEREARLLASLSHRNIAGIFGLEEAGGVRFLALEYVPGATLAERIEMGPLPVDEALAATRQIAEAMEAAHEAGVLHRDLKPANIKIAPDGTVKVLDFGLAKVVPTTSGSIVPSELPTQTSRHTRAGAILGTVSYMSPEQARGRPMDRRTDVWSFGCVLYECLAGRPAFPGDTSSDILAAILKTDPDWGALPADMPPRVVDLLQRCLTKDVRGRLRDLGDARIELDRAFAPGSDLDLASRAIDRGARPRSGPLGWVLGFVLGAALVGAGVWLLGGGGAGTAPELEVSLEVGRPVFSDEARLLVGPQLAPDGRTVAFVSTAEGQLQLFLRRLDRYEATSVAGSEGVTSFAFSPDGAWLAFVATPPGKSRRQVFKVPVDGSAPPVVMRDWDEDWETGLRWLADGTLLTLTSTKKPSLIRLPADGGPGPPPLPIQGSQDEVAPWSLLPDGRHLLGFTGLWRDEGFEIRLAVIDGETGETKLLREAGAYPRWIASGYVVFSRHEMLLAAPFDLDRLEFTGPVVPLLGGLRSTDPWSAGWFDLSDTGALVYLPGGQLGAHRRLLLAGTDGTVQPWSRDEYPLWPPVVVSPDGRRLAVGWTREENYWDIWIADLDDPGLHQLVRRSTRDCLPDLWWPGGERLAFHCDGSPEGAGVFLGPTRDIEAAERLVASESFFGRAVAYSVSPDGRYVWAGKSDSIARGDSTTLLLTMKGPTPGSPSVVEVPELRNAWDIRFSPDGRRIVYLMMQNAAPQARLRTFDADRGTLGREVPLDIDDPRAILAYRRGAGGADELVVEVAGVGLEAVDLRLEPRPSVTRGRPLLDPTVPHQSILSAAALPDGRLLLLQRGDDEGRPTRIHLTLGRLSRLP